ncbi:MAG: FMN-binding protein [Nitrosomonadales bacterium]|nr:FMN-binding protein [Nitrosomonadales bacterium]
MMLFRYLLLLLLSFSALAADQETEIERFLGETLGKPPAAEMLWIVGDLQPAARAILEHDYPAARVRYWRAGTRTVWVLDEIGKEMPITVGIAIDKGAVERVKVLVYRESRGWEVKSPSFVAQYFGAKLDNAKKLDKQIDGISGATLSVRALSRLTRLALLFDQHINKGGKL